MISLKYTGAKNIPFRTSGTSRDNVKGIASQKGYTGSWDMFTMSSLFKDIWNRQMFETERTGWRVCLLYYSLWDFYLFEIVQDQVKDLIKRKKHEWRKREGGYSLRGNGLWCVQARADKCWLQDMKLEKQTISLVQRPTVEAKLNLFKWEALVTCEQWSWNRGLSFESYGSHVG